MSTPAEEERQARDRTRRAIRLQAAAARKRERDARLARQEIIREELARAAGKRCRCGITARTTPAQLTELGAGCTAATPGRAGYVCPCLDAIRRRLTRRKTRP